MPPSPPGAGEPPEGPGGTPPSPPSPGGPPRTPNSGALPRAAWPLVAVVALLAVIGVIVYLAISGQDAGPDDRGGRTDRDADAHVGADTDGGADRLGTDPAPSPIPTAAAVATSAPAPTATPTLTAFEAWQAAEKAVREALAAYEAAEGEGACGGARGVRGRHHCRGACLRGVARAADADAATATVAHRRAGGDWHAHADRHTAPHFLAAANPRRRDAHAGAAGANRHGRAGAALRRGVGQAWGPVCGSSRTTRRWRRRSRRFGGSQTVSTSPEREGVQGLVNLATFYRPVFSALIGRPWVADGLNESETEVVQDLRWVAYGDQAAALRLLDMPFLEVIEAADADAVDSLRLLAYWRPQDFQRLLSHPTLSGGISDFWAQIVALLNDVSVTNPKLIDVLLDPGQVTVEQRTVSLPLAGNVDLAIIRTGPGALRSMDLLEDGVRRAERFMAEPFPTRHVALLFEETVSDSSPGANLGSHIAVRPEYDVDDGGPEAESAPRVIARQAARYYWSGNRDWVDEGASDFMASIAENDRTGQPVDPVNPPLRPTPRTSPRSSG